MSSQTNKNTGCTTTRPVTTATWPDLQETSVQYDRQNQNTINERPHTISSGKIIKKLNLVFKNDTIFFFFINMYYLLLQLMKKAIKDQHSASTHSKLRMLVAVVIVNPHLQFLLPLHVLPLIKHLEYNCVGIMVVIVLLYRTDVPV